MLLDGDLVARMDASLIDYWGAYARAPDARREEWPAGVFLRTPIPHSLFNSVILTGDDPATLDAALALGAEGAAAAGLPILWRVGAGAATERVRARLEGAGLTPAGPNPAMVADLAGAVEAPAVEGLVIETIEVAPARGDWAALACIGFELPLPVRTAMARCEAGIPPELFADQPRYVGTLEGKPVAVSSLVMTGDVAGIYAVAVVPEARRRGIGAAMTLHAMAEGRRRGAAIAVLQASDMGKPVYQRIGFRDAFDYTLWRQS